MTCDELKAAINDEIAQNARIAAIRSRIDAGTADFLDSELYTAITAEITAEQMRRNVLALSDREPSFVGVVRERYTDTFATFNAVQRILDAVTGIRIRTVQPEFENDRAHKIGHSLNDPTVPESVIERRAYSATENFVRSQHDRCTQANASFRSRAGLDCRITRTGGAKCCDWCASVSGSFTTSSAPDGIWGRHDNCKCSITYETRRGSFQQLSGTGKGWDTVEELPDLPLHVLDGSLSGAGEVHAVSGGMAAAIANKMGLHVLTNENERVRIRLGINLFDTSDELYVEAFSIEEEKGFTDVYLHGSPSSVQIRVNGKPKDLTPEEFESLLKSKGLSSGDIRLCSCSTGRGDNSFAQKLSEIHNGKVKAPDDDVYYAPDEGTVFIGDPNANVGNWRIFEKGAEINEND